MNSATSALPGESQLDPVISVGNLSLRLDSYRVTLDGKIVPLTYHEFELLQIFCRQIGRVVPYEDLVGNLWGFSDRAALRRLNVVVHRLRAKLGDLRLYRIETVRGRGYGLLEVMNDAIEPARLTTVPREK